MKLLKKSFLFLSIFIFIFSTNVSGNDKIFFLELDEIVNNSNIGKKTIEKINKLNAENIKNLKTRESELKKLENEIKKKRNVISDSEYKKEIDSFKKKIKEFNNEKNILVKEFNNFKKKELDLFFKKINPIIQNYMDENSIEIIIDSKYVFMGKTTSDITLKIIEKLNKNLN